MIAETVVYNSEDGKWYKLGDDPWRVRVVARGEQVREIPRVVADTYTEAFVALFGHAPFIPPVERSARRVVLA